MARSHQQVRRRSSTSIELASPAGIGVFLAWGLAGFAIVIFTLLLSSGGTERAPIPTVYIARVLGFTLWQASLSTALSLLAAVPMTRALARRTHFPGRMLLIRLCALPMVMPTIVGIFGIVAVYGGSGYLAVAAGWLRLDWRPHIYGLGGILLAHVFFNLPLAVRLLLPAYGAVPSESWRLCAQLGMRDRDIFQLIELPLLRQQVPGIAAIIFMLCFTTFAVALTLGGGPQATTLEVAIYQALRFDFDLRLGSVLALLQAVCCALGALIVWRTGRQMEFGIGLRLVGQRFDGRSVLVRAGDFASIALGSLFLVLPIAALIHRGVLGLPAAAPLPSLLKAGAISLALGLASGLTATIAGYCLAQARQHATRSGRRWLAALIGLGGRLGLFVSPMVIGTGIFLASAGRIDLYEYAAFGVILLSAILALPFVVGVLEPACALAADRHDRLCAALGVGGWHRFATIDWPTLRKPIATALALGSVIAMGDLSSIALFGNQTLTNLTLLLYQQLAAYRLAGAATTALLLLCLALALYWIIEAVVGGRDLH